MKIEDIDQFIWTETENFVNPITPKDGGCFIANLSNGSKILFFASFTTTGNLRFLASYYSSEPYSISGCDFGYDLFIIINPEYIVSIDKVSFEEAISQYKNRFNDEFSKKEYADYFPNKQDIEYWLSNGGIIELSVNKSARECQLVYDITPIRSIGVINSNHLL